MPNFPFRRFCKATLAVLAIFFCHQEFTPLGARINQPGIIYWHGDQTERKVALTFDDGPNEPYTSEVLDVLRQAHVRATFFLMGENVEAFPETAREIVREGHEIGNHSYSHRDLMFHTNSTVRSEIQETQDIIARVTGRKTSLFRPPYGSKDFFTVHQANRLGYVMIQWDVSAQDWRMPGADRIVRNVLRRVRPGSIILMHDGDKWRHGGDRSQTVAALPLLISELHKRGYTLVTVPELLNLHSPS